MELKEKKCKPCEGGTLPLKSQDIKNYLKKLDTKWEVIDNTQIRQTYKFKNFREALDFANKVGEIAEEEQHHPDLHVYYGKVTIDLATHAIGGLSENDFIVASKIEDI
ncbi:MAG: 4a-hydroxytetrahydrobiopterin dehydratase [Bacteroidales bacterium]|nr:4a-hydroxytetrahydrobiopterin dehydratase [Bacteroidales bacterium]MBS3775731.1 4a-hydroxytetrahydrobiopterin dehydratase [Bacteroidales bacterium]